ncbi:MAG: hypothetical protein GQ581_01205 [Methyloprofundus sp.]|nr:hypothetical protein [Methyloprofundus sp.]
MKKIIVLLFVIGSFFATSNIQARDLENINNTWQSEGAIAETQSTTATNGFSSEAKPPSSALIILIIAGFAGFFFAKKHQSLAKKHKNRDLANRHEEVL